MNSSFCLLRNVLTHSQHFTYVADLAVPYSESGARRSLLWHVFSSVGRTLESECNNLNTKYIEEPIDHVNYDDCVQDRVERACRGDAR